MATGTGAAPRSSLLLHRRPLPLQRLAVVAAVAVVVVVVILPSPVGLALVAVTTIVSLAAVAAGLGRGEVEVEGLGREHAVAEAQDVCRRLVPVVAVLRAALERITVSAAVVLVVVRVDHPAPQGRPEGKVVVVTVWEPVCSTLVILVRVMIIQVVVRMR